LKNFTKISTQGVLFASLVFILLTFTLSPVSAQEDKSAAELRKDLDNLNLTSSGKYYELSDMRSKTDLMLLEMERVNVSSDVKQFIFSVKEFLKNFENAYEKSAAGSPMDHKESIDDGVNMKKMASDMDHYKTWEGLKKYHQVPAIVDAAHSVGKRFLDAEGSYFEDLADLENITPIKLDYLDSAIRSYDEAENIEAREDIKGIYKELNIEFNTDMENARIDKTDADVLLEKTDALKDSQNPLDLISAVISSTEAMLKYGNVEQTYADHNLNSERCSKQADCSSKYYSTYIEAVDKGTYTADASKELMSLIIKYMVIIAVIILIIVYMFKRSYSKYKDDDEDSKLGGELGLQG